MRGNLVVGDGHGFSRALDGVDADRAKDHPLGGLYEYVAGSEYLVDGGDGLGAVGEGGDCLCSPDGKHPIHTSDSGSCEDDGSYRTIGAGGVTRMTSRTPATRAGMAVIKTVEG